MDPNKIQQFVQDALKKGHSPDEINKFIESQQKTESILKQVMSGLTPEESKLQSDLQTTAATDTLKSNLDLQQLPKQKQIEQDFALDTEQKKMDQKAQFERENPQESEAIKTEKFKKQSTFKDVSDSVDILEKNLKQVRQRGKVAGGFAELMAGLTGGAANPEVADYEALRKSLIGPLARAISGEVGVLTDRDIARAEQLLPKVSDAPKLIENKLQNLREIIGVRTGQKVSDQKFSQESLVNPDASSIQNSQPQKQESYEGTSALMALLEGRPDQIPQALSNLMKKSNFEGGWTDEQGNLNKNLTPEQKQKQIKQTVNQAIGFGVLPMKTAQASKSGIDLVKNLFSGKARNAAAETVKDVKFSGKDIAEAGAEYVKRQPLAKGVADKILPSLRKETFTPQQLLDRLSEWGKLTYTKGGDAKSTAGGQMFNALYASARKQLAEKTPEVSKLQSLLSKGHTAGRVTKKYAVPALTAGIIGSLLYRAGGNK